MNGLNYLIHTTISNKKSFSSIRLPNLGFDPGTLSTGNEASTPSSINNEVMDAPAAGSANSTQSNGGSLQKINETSELSLKKQRIELLEKVQVLTRSQSIALK